MRILLVGFLFAFAVPVGAQTCDASLWRHVYNPPRLLRGECVSVTGIIMDATKGKRKDGQRHEADGDNHGWLKVDPGQGDFVNEGNKKSEDGNLVFEVVCKYKVTQKDAIDACLGYVSPIVIPPVGSHVRITGTLVQETNHDKWIEIHPVTSIEVIK